MTATVTTSTLIGAESRPVFIEADMSNSLPGTVIVGLGDKAVSEAKERVRSAIKNSKLEHPKKRITINLSPADIPKDGSHFDLGIALSILLLSGQLPEDCLKDTMVLGELGLDGSVRPVSGIIGHIMCAQQLGVKRVILPQIDLPAAKLMDGVELTPVKSLRNITDHLAMGSPLPAIKSGSFALANQRFGIDLSDVAGQPMAKRALEIVAAGGHNLLMSGPPGGGKTMLAKTLPTIMPSLTKKQMIESTHLHNIAGHTANRIINTPPFRSPHHSASHVSLVGGGAKASPGEATLAHNGVLFLDEIPEFSRQSLESLRQPLEDGRITVSRASTTVTYPARSIMVGTKNPCPCGYYGDSKRTCECSQAKIDAYQNKLSGPLLDRIDVHVHVEPTEHAKLLAETSDGDSSRIIQKRVQAARSRQLARQNCTNAELNSKQVKHNARLTPADKQFLDEAANTLHLSSRSYLKVVRVARTIADLAGDDSIKKTHLAEALQFRPPPVT